MADGSSTFGSGQLTQDLRSTATGHGANAGNSVLGASATDAATVITGTFLRGGGGANYNFQGPATAELLKLLQSQTPAASKPAFDWQKVLPYAAFAVTSIGVAAVIFLRKK